MRDARVCQVEFIPPEDATGDVRAAYDAVTAPGRRVDHLYQAMALSPAAIVPADQLYRALLHNDDCPFEPWLRELISTQVAILCQCDYAAIHHGENLHDFFRDRAWSEELLDGIRQGRWRSLVSDHRLSAILDFNERLTSDPGSVAAHHIDALRTAGLTDKEIVYLVQIGASFAYWARVLIGLGTVIGDEPIGLAAKPGAGQA